MRRAPHADGLTAVNDPAAGRNRVVFQGNSGDRSIPGRSEQAMLPHPLAGKPAPADALANVPRLVTAYFTERPDPANAAERVAFGTSGHRGSALKRSFNDAQLAAIAHAVVQYRRAERIDGPLFLGIDTHALSEPAFATVLEVLAAEGVDVMIDAAGGYTPTPVVSHAILAYNRDRRAGLADGLVVTPSHNPPEDGGIKYNPPHGGPAEARVTAAIELAANRALADGLRAVRRVPLARARAGSNVHRHDFVAGYVDDLASALDLAAIKAAGLRVGVDPLGGSSVAYWQPIAERHGLRLEVVNASVDPTFRFMPLDRDGRIRMDCSSPYAMAGLIALRSRYDVAFGNDPDADRHGIVTRTAGLMNPNHYLATAIDYLLTHRPGWKPGVAIGKTLVSSSLIDRVAARRGRRLFEVPVGFKWFVEGLRSGALGFAGEESAGASFLRRDGAVWTTDKDGLLLGLLAAEMTAVTGRDPGELYAELTRAHGTPYYERIDVAASPGEKAVLGRLSERDLAATSLAGEPIEAVLTRAPGDGNAIGGLKVATRNGWFAARPSGTEDVYKIYAESLVGAEHLARIQDEARALVAALFAAAAPGIRTAGGRDESAQAA
jgi:phosphoglucomutase